MPQKPLICPPGYTDHVFKVEEGVEVPLRIWKAPGTKGGKRPWVYWIHGGGWIGGKHAVPNLWVIPAFHQLDFHVVSVGYRLLPHVQMPDIMQDIIDGMAWCRCHLPQLLGADTIDIDIFVAAGDSAGGTMSSLCGLYLDPKPSVVIDIYGIVDMLDPYYYIPLTEADMERLGFGDVDDDTKAEQLDYLASRDKGKAEVLCPWVWEREPHMTQDQLRANWGMPGFNVLPKHQFRDFLNRRVRIDGSRIPLLLQREKFATEEEYLADVKRKWSVHHMIDDTYPPTFILHGDADTSVPIEQSYRFEARLKELGVEVEAVYCPGKPHAFDSEIQSPNEEGWRDCIAPCIGFVEKHIKQ